MTTIISVVSFPDVSVPKSTEVTITCSIAGLSQNTPITWVGADGKDISTKESSNYGFNEESFSNGNKVSELTIKQPVLSDLSTESVFKCKLQSVEFPDNSPEVVKEMTLTLLELSEYGFLVVFYSITGLSIVPIRKLYL